MGLTNVSVFIEALHRCLQHIEELFATTQGKTQLREWYVKNIHGEHFYASADVLMSFNEKVLKDLGNQYEFSPSFVKLLQDQQSLLAEAQIAT